MRRLQRFFSFVLTAAITFSAVAAQASTLFLSASGTSPVNELTNANPTIQVARNAPASLFLWWKPTTDPTTSQPEKVDGLSHDIVSSNPILSRTSYAIDNPSIFGNARWNSVSTGGGAATFMVDDANAINLSGSNLGSVPNPAFDNTYDTVTGTWRVATLTFQAGNTTGISNIFLAVGNLGISFARGSNTDPSNLPINFGFGDAAVDSHNFGAQTTIADGTVVVVPEPATMILIGMGAVGLVVVARRRRKAEEPA